MKTPDSISKARQKLFTELNLWEQKRTEVSLNQSHIEEKAQKLAFIEAEIAKLKAEVLELRTGTYAQRLAGFANPG